MQKINSFFRVFIRRFFEDLVAVRAASLAFTTLLSIVPLFIFIFYLLSFFPTLTAAGNQLEKLIVTHFVANSAHAILDQLRAFLANVQHLSWLNMVALAFTSWLLIFNMVDAVNGVWHVKMTKFSALALIFYWIVLSVLPIIFALLLLASSYLMSLPIVSIVEKTSFVQALLLIVLPLLLEWLTFSLFHFLMPSCVVQWRYAAIAGLTTTIAFELAKSGFVQYLRYFPTYQLVYGALASIPIFFIWVFLTWLIIIASALLCDLLQKSAKK
ncbi:MAG: YihY family inner membrane protein [Coxiellaceae bacterium]|nr:YihY family inner membrane protein [Coxiellaceae bacterium]